jgi:hypothetical protein
MIRVSRTYLARTGLAVSENGSIVAVQHTVHEPRGADVVDLLLLHLVVEHGIEEEIFGRFAVVGFRVAHANLPTGRISGGCPVINAHPRIRYAIARS